MNSYDTLELHKWMPIKKGKDEQTAIKINICHYSQGFLRIFIIYIATFTGFYFEMSTMYFWYFPKTQ